MADNDAYIVVTKSEILELMGELALPPFPGHPEADDWACSPMADRISKRVELFFQSKLPGSEAAKIGERVESQGVPVESQGWPLGVPINDIHEDFPIIGDDPRT